MSAGERVARQLREAATLLESMADDVGGDIDERFVKKDYLARKRLA